jgi:hypothetical protein
MKLGDVPSSGELTGVAFAVLMSEGSCNLLVAADLEDIISRLEIIRANYLHNIYLRVLGRVLTFLLETKSRSAQV